MNGIRLLYGLDRVPATLAADDPRLPSVWLGEEPLRLNSLPLPVAAWEGGTDHAERMDAMLAWLQSQCGDYNVALHRFMKRYLEGVAAHVAEHRTMLDTKLAVFEGLYRAEDWCWSALRPLPRAWWPVQDGWHHADVAFWDGVAITTVKAGEPPPPFRPFWEGQILPASPFRRTLPAGLDGPRLRPSFP